jgi:hypothetical protein
MGMACLWSLSDQSAQFDLGHVLSCAVTDAILPVRTGELGLHHAGLWECDLSDNSLIWSGGVYDLFGIRRGEMIGRDDALAFYTEHSRSKMERLRSHAIAHMVGFTIDIELRPASVGAVRRVRLIAAPVLEGHRAARLHGLKLAI